MALTERAGRNGKLVWSSVFEWVNDVRAEKTRRELFLSPFFFKKKMESILSVIAAFWKQCLIEMNYCSFPLKNGSNHYPMGFIKRTRGALQTLFYQCSELCASLETNLFEVDFGGVNKWNIWMLSKYSELSVPFPAKLHREKLYKSKIRTKNWVNPPQ